MTKKDIKNKYKAMLREIKKRKSEVKGGINCYQCPDCGHVDKYYYADTGVTPFITQCSNCGGMSRSTMGNDIAPELEPQHEWYRPSLAQVQFMQRKYPALFEHVLNGGLQPRPIDYTGYDRPMPIDLMGLGSRAYHFMFGWCRITHPPLQLNSKTVVSLDADEISYLADGHRKTYQRPGNGDHSLYTPLNQLFRAEPLNPHPWLVHKKKRMRPEIKFWDKKEK